MLYRLYQKHIFPHLLNQVMQTPSLMDLRRELLLGVSGEVLEIGFGTGINLAFYQNVDTVYALEPNAAVFQLAQERIDAAPFLVEHIAASAEQLPFADEQLQHVVSTWTLCSIADLAQSLREIYRVLQPGGTLHVVEHVLNRQSLNIQRLQHLLTPIQKKVADGCHLNRDIEVALLETGFELGEVRYIDVAGIPSLAQRMLLARVHKPK
ncbi:MAG: class I SAM-dependent methyltransferase [Gammaproteobacteria bacterium]|jgi:ubiquinone/menaquinone biosynthesis C-methylase UbiE|uniref:class I SAM-dependent methyltransferase n=1 Tax=Acinetobacter sp. SwsAc5 TaxID=2749438 RepID=UPI0015B7AAC4|nr:class I SAM-dependent methyltransferase [Acinetobacter sp. SwsAc5]NLN56629.1 class I SAM-dependent methyltransferase [Gammaproteobacteria bacterium]NWK52291.1 class I SAM-dependent methyltransferase [Acinetobacter sp. SwsAc5]